MRFRQPYASSRGASNKWLGTRRQFWNFRELEKRFPLEAAEIAIRRFKHCSMPRPRDDRLEGQSVFTVRRSPEHRSGLRGGAFDFIRR